MGSDVWQGQIAREMAGATFQDPRLARRLGQIVGKLVERPATSFPNVFESAALEAAYRFFGNAKVTPDAILSGHFEATRLRCVELPRVLVVHDSTTLNFREDGQRRGLGRLVKSGQAFFAHVSLALAGDGSRRPLGVTALKTWTRSDETLPSERLRWAEQIELSAARLQGVANVVHLADREADDYALFARASGTHRFIVRAMHDRLLCTEQKTDPRKLSEAIAHVERTVEREAPLSKRIDGSRSPKQKSAHPSRGARMASLKVGATRVLVKRPTTQNADVVDSLWINVVRVWEPDPPTGESAIEWILWTTEPIDTPEDLAWIVDAYRARWTIEEYFKALKTGCAYESRQLEDYEGLVNALAVFAPIACHLLEVRSEARRVPDAPASTVMSATHLEVLRALGRYRLPDIPTVRDVLLAVAALGGHIKYSGEPGWLTLARGHAELRTLARGWAAAKLPPRRDQG